MKAVWALCETAQHVPCQIAFESGNDEVCNGDVSRKCQNRVSNNGRLQAQGVLQEEGVDGSKEDSDPDGSDKESVAGVKRDYVFEAKDATIAANVYMASALA